MQLAQETKGSDTPDKAPEHRPCLSTRILTYFNKPIEFCRWELIKYGLIALCIVLPCFGRVIHYASLSCLGTFIAFYCLCFGLLVLFRVPRRWTIPFIVLGISGLAYQFALGKPLGYQTLTAMYETNYRETLGFFVSLSSVAVVVLGVIALLFILRILTENKPLPHFQQPTFVRRRYLLPFLLLALVLFQISNWRIMETYPLCLFRENFMYVEENVTISDYLNTSYTCPQEYLRAGTNEETFVLIIGESARRSSLSAYGYQRETSPRLDAWIKERPEQVILFRDAITPSAFTKASVMSIYSPLLIKEELSAQHSRPGLSKVFKGSGFNTLYVTTRPKYNIRNMLSTFQDDAEQRTYLTTHLKRAYDEETLPVIQRFLDTKPGKRLIILHLMGSHREYASQYPKNWRHFKSGDKMLDTYDDSILYSDHVIHELLDSLSTRPEPVFALYVSDHGENLNEMKDGYYGHGAKALTRYDLHVPFVMYFNKGFMEKHADAYTLLRGRSQEPVHHDYVAHTFMGLAGISDPFIYKNNLDLASTNFQPCARIITDENMRPFDYATYKFSPSPHLAEVGEKLAEEYLAKFTW